MRRPFLPTLTAGGGVATQRLVDYVKFANTCHTNSGGDFSFAVYTIEGQPRQNWPHQNDGPALQTIAILRTFDDLSTAFFEQVGVSQQTAFGDAVRLLKPGSTGEISV
jgi:hypothetical protein